jgi:transposase
VPDSTPNLEQAIADNAAGPSKASVDGQSVEQHAIRDQIEADRYLESKRATRRRGLGIRLFKIVAGGAGGAGGTGGREGGC